MRRAIEFCLAVVAALMLLADAHAQLTDPARTTDDSLRIYAVDIWQDPPQSWGPGRGVYLGKGLVLTAAHVVGSVAQTKPRVHIAGMELPATALREGNFERADLTQRSSRKRAKRYRQIFRAGIDDPRLHTIEHF